jgi:hypothetical protein
MSGISHKTQRPGETSIEEIILGNDRRGISALRGSLPADYCVDAAGYVLDRPGTVLIGTGFYILSGAAVETDGPPGAVAIGTALQALGRRVVYVTDAHGADVMRAVAGPGASVVEFPVEGPEESVRTAKSILAEYEPSLLIGIERCAPDAEDVYRNMRSIDITPHTARVDRLFDLHEESVGIGDGGNEIGMGLLASEIASVASLPDAPAVTRTAKLVIASLSNWGAWGLLAAMSQIEGRDLLPTLHDESERVQRCVKAGAVDGFSGERSAKVDGFELDDYLLPLAALRALL